MAKLQFISFLLLLVGLIGSGIADPVPAPTKPKLRGVTMISPPFTNKEENGTLTGFAVDLIELIAQKANFDYDLVLQPDGKYGVIQNGSVDGMIGEVHSKKADFAIADLTETDQRKEYVQFSEPMITSQLAALIRRDIAKDFTKLEDIVAYNDVQLRDAKPDNQIGFGAVGHGATIYKLNNSEDPNAKKMAAWIVAHPEDKLKSRQAGVQRVIEGRFTMVLERTFADYEAQRNNCSLVALYDQGGAIFERNQSIALPKDSNYAAAISAALVELKKDGTVDKLRAKYWKNECAAV